MIVMVEGEQNDYLTQVAKRLDLFGERALYDLFAMDGISQEDIAILVSIILDIAKEKLTEADLARVKLDDWDKWECYLYKGLS
ncbi:hypothetical protein [Moritella dasanensis]|uniref:hypothetical protein n=1 Tax=Moritella dasanensis TaxID=428031 RepID=UPI0003642875|nr:hypothetical protein [Moritella dasanensis]